MPATTLWGWIPNVALVPGPAGPLPAQMATDTFGRASLRTRPDTENTFPDAQPSPSLFLSIINALTTVLWTNTGASPVATPLTQQSILDVVQTYGGGLTEVGPFEVPSLSSPAGATVELESVVGMLCAAVKGLGFSPDGKDGGLTRTQPLTFNTPDNTPTLSVNPLTNHVAVGGSLSTAFTTQPTGIYTLSPTGCSTLLITDVSSPVSVLLTASALPPGTTFRVQSTASVATNPITITDTGGATFNGASSYIISERYTAAAIFTDGSQWYY